MWDLGFYNSTFNSELRKSNFSRGFRNKKFEQHLPVCISLCISFGSSSAGRLHCLCGALVPINSWYVIWSFHVFEFLSEVQGYLRRYRFSIKLLLLENLDSQIPGDTLVQSQYLSPFLYYVVPPIPKYPATSCSTARHLSLPWRTSAAQIGIPIWKSLTCFENWCTTFRVHIKHLNISGRIPYFISNFHLRTFLVKYT